MTTFVCKHLDSMEVCLKKMTVGVFLFIFHRLPDWIIRTLVEAVGPIVIRATRVSFFLSLWLGIVFAAPVGSIILAITDWWESGEFGWSPAVVSAAMIWSILAVFGSIWGLYRVVKKRNVPVLEAVEKDAADVRHQQMNRRDTLSRY